MPAGGGGGFHAIFLNDGLRVLAVVFMAVIATDQGGSVSVVGTAQMHYY